MKIGIFARIFERPTVEEVLDAVVEQGITAIQFNWMSAGLDPLPAEVDNGLIDHVRQAAEERALTLASVSGTFNMIHPDPALRAEGMRCLRTVIATAPQLGTKVVTLCTGTRNRESMWSNHPDNGAPDAWRDLLASVEQALTAASQYDVVLGIEPEVSNVVSSPRKARQLLDSMQSPHLGIIMDGANVFPSGGLQRQHEILDETFDLLGDDIVLAHAKDISRDGEAGHEAAGTGLLDYDHYIGLLQQSPYAGALVLHSLSEEQAPACIAFLQLKLQGAKDD